MCSWSGNISLTHKKVKNIRSGTKGAVFTLQALPTIYFKWMCEWLLKFILGSLTPEQASLTDANRSVSTFPLLWGEEERELPPENMAFMSNSLYVSKPSLKVASDHLQIQNSHFHPWFEYAEYIATATGSSPAITHFSSLLKSGVMAVSHHHSIVIEI